MDVADLLTGTLRLDRAVVSMSGEIDVFTVPSFRTLVDRALSTGADTVVVDLSGVTFMDAQGLTVLVEARRRLDGSERQLVVQAPRAPVRRLFEITDLTSLLAVPAPPPSSPLVRTLAVDAAEPLTQGLLDSALELVVVMAQAVVGGADGASITMPRHGQLSTVAASNDTVLEMDTDQYESGEGPCLDAASQGERFHTDSLDTEARWPGFVPRARARGIRSIMSTPLMDGAAPLGALNIYSRSVDAFAEHEQRWADAFAAQAARVVAKARTAVPAHDLAEQLRRALASREVIALAQGITLSRAHCTPPQAYAELRNSSVRTGLPLLQVCQHVIADESLAPTHPLDPGGGR